jgi:1-deoxyxylulose-5-phosphate synthase
MGTMTFGFQCDEETSRSILDAAAEAGVTFIDTADAYPLGGSLETVGTTESILGRWLEGRRDDFVIATKCYFPMGRRRFQRGLSRRHIFDACDASLRRLRTDYIDLYQVHNFDAFTPLEETLGALSDLVQMGKVRYLGCCNQPAYQVARARGISGENGWAKYLSVQSRYNLLFRQIEREVVPLCKDDGLGLIPYSPLGGGFLTGKHKPGTPTDGTRFTLGSASELFQRRYWNGESFDAVAQLARVAEEAGVPLATLATAWVLANSMVTSAIVGASRPDQLTMPLAAIENPISADIKAELDGITDIYRQMDPTGDLG